MPTLGVLSWLNESGLGPYPLSESFGLNAILVDANFLQFDAFTPVLQTIVVTSNTIIFNITFDVGLLPITIDTSSLPTSYKIYNNSRYLGTIVFGFDLQTLIDVYMDQTIKVGVSFLPHLVKGIPSHAGVYSIDGRCGALTFNHDVNIWYTVAGQNVTFNAVSLPDANSAPFLKTLNSVAPTTNNVRIQETNLLKINGSSQGTIQFSVIGTSVNNLIDSVNSTIPTNPSP